MTVHPAPVVALHHGGDFVGNLLFGGDHYVFRRRHLAGKGDSERRSCSHGCRAGTFMHSKIDFHALAYAGDFKGQRHHRDARLIFADLAPLPFQQREPQPISYILSDKSLELSHRRVDVVSRGLEIDVDRRSGMRDECEHPSTAFENKRGICAHEHPCEESVEQLQVH
jgi:hypothetical protein